MVPFVIVMTTLIVGIASTDDAYIKMQKGEVVFQSFRPHDTYFTIVKAENQSTSSQKSMTSSHDVLMSPQKVVACFLHDNYVFALFVPAAIVLFGNLGVTITAVYIAHR